MLKCTQYTAAAYGEELQVGSFADVGMDKDVGDLRVQRCQYTADTVSK